MAILAGLNPSCYLPFAMNSWLPQAIKCPPPPSYTDIAFASITRPLSATASAVKYTYDAFIGLQFLSFFLIPTVTSYSTSLNVLFFYLTWSTLVLSHDALQVEIVASLAIKILFYVLPSAVMLVFDLVFPQLSSSIKRQGGDGLLLRSNNRKNITKTVKVIGNSLTNILLGIALQAGAEWSLKHWGGIRPAIRVTTTLPLPWGMARDLLKGFFARDALTWVVRRYLLHDKKSKNHIVRDLSSLHKRWYHTTVTTPFPLSPSYDHPLIYLLRVFLPIYLPVMFWNFHALTYMVYLALISLEETLTHSGYSRLPTHFVLGGIAGRNDLYCLTRGRGNYGTWGFIDWLAGTSIGTEFTDDVADEVEEADVQGKIVQQANRSMAKVKRAVNGRSDKESSSTSTKRRTRRTKNDSDSE